MAHIAMTLGVCPGAFAFSGQPSGSDTVTIGDVTYTFVASPSSANDVDIGSDVDESIENLVAAINAGDGEGTAYGTGTEANPYVTAEADTTDDEVDLTARVAGDQVNAVALAKSGTNIAVEAASFGLGANTGHVDGAGSLPDFVDDVVARNQVNAEVLTALLALTAADD